LVDNETLEAINLLKEKWGGLKENDGGGEFSYDAF
jgi:hypothetical protein